MLDQDVFLEKALLEDGRVATEQLSAAKRFATEEHVDLTDALVATETISSREIALTRADVFEVSFVDVGHFEVSHANTRLVRRSIAERYCLFPIFLVDGVLTLAMDDPLNLEALDNVRRFAKCEVDAVLCDREILRSVIARAYSLSVGNETVIDADEVKDTDGGIRESDQPIVAAVNHILTDALAAGASDVHFNPDEYELRLRFRIDGELQERQAPPLSMHAGLVQRIKVMAKLDLTQTRRPQDGKFRVRRDNRQVEVRVSTMPTVCGENVVLRILSSDQAAEDFHELGMTAHMVADVSELIAQPHGMLLVTGPTGSGKTSTLYASLRRLNSPSRNIMTIEDPVEIRLPYVRQIQVNSEIGLTFASALRTVLRQDPDVVLVGEIRDNETATIALQAALTGHLVLSTLHTNDSAGAVARLRDYGVPSFVINSTVVGIVAQRLVRRVCQHCVVDAPVDDLLRHRFKLNATASGYVHGEGCARCRQTGYRGRVGIYELLKLSPAIQSLIERDGTIRQIRELAVSEGMHLLWQDGLEKAKLRVTSLDEVARVAAVVAIDDGASVESAAA